MSVVGPTALTLLNGGWTYTWQGTNASLFPPGVPRVLDAIGKHAEVVSEAKQADVAIVVLGEDAYAEWVGDIDDLTLPEPQLDLAAAVEATDVPTILVLLEGRPRIIRAVADSAKGIVMAYWPGMEGADAIADILFGDVNPSGRLPFTYPRYPNALVLDDHRFTETLDTGFDRKPDAFNPQFAFGSGLSYDIRLQRPASRSPEGLRHGEEYGKPRRPRHRGVAHASALRIAPAGDAMLGAVRCG